MSLSLDTLFFRPVESRSSVRTPVNEPGKSGDEEISGHQETREKPGVIVSLSSSAAVSKPDEANEDIQQTQRDAEIEALSRKKGDAKGKLQELMKQFRLIKEAWAHDPKGMAKQLARLASDLKDILDEYKSAQKALAKIMGPAGGGMGSGMPGVSMPLATGATSAETSDDQAAEEARTDHQATEAAEVAEAAVEAESINEDGTINEFEPETEDTGLQLDAQTPQAASKGIEAYQKVSYEKVRLDQTPQAGEIRGDIEFAKMVRGVFTKIKDEYTQTKRVAMGTFGIDVSKDKDYKELDKVFKKVDKESFEFEADMIAAMPPAIEVMRPVQA